VRRAIGRGRVAASDVRLSSTVSLARQPVVTAASSVKTTIRGTDVNT
jgi:hypothetical protein